MTFFATTLRRRKVSGSPLCVNTAKSTGAAAAPHSIFASICKLSSRQPEIWPRVTASDCTNFLSPECAEAFRRWRFWRWSRGMATFRLALMPLCTETFLLSDTIAFGKRRKTKNGKVKFSELVWNVANWIYPDRTYSFRSYNSPPKGLQLSHGTQFVSGNRQKNRLIPLRQYYSQRLPKSYWISTSVATRGSHNAATTKTCHSGGGNCAALYILKGDDGQSTAAAAAFAAARQVLREQQKGKKRLAKKPKTEEEQL